MRQMPLFFGRTGNAIKWLLIINIGVFVLQQFSQNILTISFGLIPSKTLFGLQVWRLLTYMFLHGGFFHLLFNMFALWMFGKELENLWGSKEFVKFYFFCGIGAGVFNTLFEPLSLNPIIGASGAIYGILVAFALSFPTTVIYLYGIIPIQAKHFVIMIGVMEFFLGFDGRTTTIARLAHLGGMLTGYLYLKSFEFRSRINNTLKHLSDFFLVKKPKIKAKKTMKKEDVIKEVDRILEKVLLQGVDSLTDKEREIMRRYSSMKH